VESLKNIARRVRDTGNLARRVEELEAEVQECRQLNLRLAELTDVVAELLLPAADRDEARIAEVLQSYRDSVNDPPVPGTR
jgi:hypothetical protein